MGLSIAEIRPADHEQWKALFTAYRAGYDTTAAEDERVLATTWSWLTDDADPTRALVAADGPTLVGFAHVRTYGRPSDARTVVQLEDLFTAPEHRGRGVARALVGAVARIAAEEGHAVVRWTASQSNVGALRLYDELAERSTRITYDLVP